MRIEPKGNTRNKNTNNELLLNDEKSMQSLEDKLLAWISQYYPSVSGEKNSIAKDVLKKLYKKVTNDNSNVDLSIIELEKEMLILGEKECKLALPTEENKQKNMGLTRQAFKDYVDQLKNGNEDLIEKVYLSHFEKCVRFLMFQFNSSYEDAYESSLDALFEIRKDLINDKIFYGNLAYYFTTRAKSKLYKANLKTKLPLASIEGKEFVDDASIEQSVHEDQLKQIIADALDQLCDDCRSIIKQYYYEELSFKEIALKMDKKHDAIRQEARRCRNKLRKYLGEKFYQQFSIFFDN